MCRYILEARELPIISMIKRIFNQLSTWLRTKREELESFTGPICPKVQKQLDKFIELSNNCFISNSARAGVYLVDSCGRDYIVELLNNSCSCQRWNLTGIPCHHAIACMRQEKISPTTRVHPCYSVETYRKVYAHIFMPLRDESEWDRIVNCPTIGPPKYEKKVGRKRRIGESNLKRRQPVLEYTCQSMEQSSTAATVVKVATTEQVVQPSKQTRHPNNKQGREGKQF